MKVFSNRAASAALIGFVLVAGLLGGCADKAVNKEAIAAGELLATKGRDGIPACAGCHGAQGEGNTAAGFPRLAALNPDYLAKQLHDFARELPAAGVVTEPIARDYSKTPRIYSDLTVFSPGIRKDPIMGPIAKQLSDEDVNNLAAYYASLSFSAQPQPADFQTLERGADLALRGKPEYGLPACISCHGPDGVGFE